MDDHMGGGIILGEQGKSQRPAYQTWEPPMWKHNMPGAAVPSLPSLQPARLWTSRTAMTGLHGARPRGPWPGPAKWRRLNNTPGPSLCPCAEVPSEQAIPAHTPTVPACAPTPDTGAPALKVPPRSLPHSTLHRNVKPKTLLSHQCKNSSPW